MMWHTCPRGIPARDSFFQEIFTSRRKQVDELEYARLTIRNNICEFILSPRTLFYAAPPGALSAAGTFLP
jgi:hypothetical protein